MFFCHDCVVPSVASPDLITPHLAQAHLVGEVHQHLSDRRLRVILPRAFGFGVGALARGRQPFGKKRLAKSSNTRHAETVAAGHDLRSFAPAITLPSHNLHSCKRPQEGHKLKRE